jgi:hypothetical protein
MTIRTLDGFLLISMRHPHDDDRMCGGRHKQFSHAAVAVTIAGQQRGIEPC